MPPFVLLGFAKKCAKIYYACKAMVHSWLYKVPVVVMYKKSHCRHISVVFTSIFTIQNSEVTEIFQANQNTACLLPLWYGQPEKFSSIRPRKSSEIHTGIFGRTENAQRKDSTFSLCRCVHVVMLLLCLKVRMFTLQRPSFVDNIFMSLCYYVVMSLKPLFRSETTETKL